MFVEFEKALHRHQEHSARRKAKKARPRVSGAKPKKKTTVLKKKKNTRKANVKALPIRFEK